MDIIIKWIIIYCILSYIINTVITKIMIKKMAQSGYAKDINKMLIIGIYIVIILSPFTMPLMIYKVVLGKG